MKFVIIDNMVEYKAIVSDVFRSLFGNNITIEEDNNDIVIYHSYENDLDIYDSLQALETALYVTVKAYMSYDNKEPRLKEELALYKELKDDLPVGVYNFKSAMLNADRIPNKRAAFEFVIYKTGVTEEIINGIVNANLNVSSAAKELNFHRNTMNYKLDKLKELSGFDLRNFKDTYIIYMLMERK